MVTPGCVMAAKLAAMLILALLAKAPIKTFKPKTCRVGTQKWCGMTECRPGNVKTKFLTY